MRRLFWLVASIVLVDTMFYAAITPLLPEYAGELGLSKSAAGVLSASYAAGTLLGSLPGGWLAARLGVKPTVLVGLALMGGSGLVFAFAEDIVVLDTARFLQGVGGAFTWTGALAWLLAAAPRDRRGEMIGSALAAAIAGVLLGPVIGGIATVAGPEPVFSGAALLGAVLATIAWTTPAAAPTPPPSVRSVAAATFSAPLLAGFWLVALPSAFSGVLEVLAPLRLDQLGTSGVVIGAVFLVAAGLEAVASRAFGAVSDRRGRLIPIRAGLAASTVAAILLPLPGRALPFAAVVIGALVALASFWAPAMALLSDSAEARGLDLGFAIAMINLAWAGGQVLGGLGRARLADASSDTVPYLTAAALFAISLAAVVWSQRRPATGSGRCGRVRRA